jgi:hypothetical protein
MKNLKYAFISNSSDAEVFRKTELIHRKNQRANRKVSKKFNGSWWNGVGGMTTDESWRRKEKKPWD